jgi:uncharacterized delta-60 repeat protein
MRGRSFLVGVVLAGLLPIMLPSVPAWAVGGGTLDPTFGTGGKVLTDFGGQDMAYGMAVQADGKVVAAGFENAGGNYDFALARYNRDGTLDATFGAGGEVLTDVSGAGSYDVARAVAVQPNGKIVVAGGSNAVRGTDHDFALARYNRDGTLDATFGTGGKVLTDVTGEAYAVAVQPGGKIVAAGSSNTDFALVRYNRDGTLDSTFGAGGRVLTDFGGNDYAYAVAVRPGGKIVAAGFSDARGSYDFALARYNRDGTLDATFGAGGTVLTDVSGAGSYDDARAVAVQPNGKIVAVGGSNAARGTDHDFALARYNRDGTLDATFGTGGKVLTDVSGAGSYDVALAVAIQPNGKIVTAGASGAVRNADFALARYNRDGTLDATFGAGGKVVTDVSGTGSDNEAFAVAVQPDGKIVAAGASGTIRSDFALARYQP